jgi:molybdopterin-guanine dinucleotide biosynthesis protein A
MSGLRVDAIVLAGGSSSRMGRDKAQIELGGKSLLTRVVQAAYSLPEVGRVLVVGRSRLPDDLDIDTREIVCVPDEVADLGPLAGVASGLGKVWTEHALVLACDGPWPQQALLSALLDRSPGCDAVVPRWNHHPQVLCAVYARSLLPLMRSALDEGERSLRRFLGRIPHLELMSEETVRTFDPTGRSFINFNTPEDLKRVEGVSQARKAR